MDLTPSDALAHMSERRLAEMYNRLVENTENPTVYSHQIHSQILRFALAMLEYILESNDDNPIDETFIDPY